MISRSRSAARQAVPPSRGVPRLPATKRATWALRCHVARATRFRAVQTRVSVASAFSGIDLLGVPAQEAPTKTGAPETIKYREKQEHTSANMGSAKHSEEAEGEKDAPAAPRKMRWFNFCSSYVLVGLLLLGFAVASDAFIIPPPKAEKEGTPVKMGGATEIGRSQLGPILKVQPVDLASV